MHGEKNEISIFKKQKIIIVIFSILQILLVLWLAVKIVHADVSNFFDIIYCYFPIGFLVSVFFISAILSSAISIVKKRQEIFSKPIKVVWSICIIICIFVIILVYSKPFVSSQEKQIFQENFSLEHMISQQYNAETDFNIDNPTRKWGKTRYIRGEVLENRDKITSMNMDREAYQQLPDVSAECCVITLKNVPVLFQEQIQSMFQSKFSRQLDELSFKDLSKVESLEYQDATVKIYYDTNLFLETERIVIFAQHGQNYLLYSLIFQDTSHQMYVEKDYILDQAVAYLAETD